MHVVIQRINLRLCAPLRCHPPIAPLRRCSRPKFASSSCALSFSGSPSACAPPLTAEALSSSCSCPGAADSSTLGTSMSLKKELRLMSCRTAVASSDPMSDKCGRPHPSYVNTNGLTVACGEVVEQPRDFVAFARMLDRLCPLRLGLLRRVIVVLNRLLRILAI